MKAWAELHDAVVSKYSWLIHDTGLAKFDFVRANGLVLRQYEPYEIPQDVQDYWVDPYMRPRLPTKWYHNGANLDVLAPK